MRKILTAIVALAGLALSAPAATKNYYFPEVRTEVEVQADGSFTVDEFRTYEFEGSFSWADIWIPLRFDRAGRSHDISITDFGVSDENGSPLPADVSRQDGYFTAKWHYSAKNERRTFHIHYRMTGAVLSYPDATDLYWQAIGNRWEKPTKKAVVTVHLPRPLSRKEDLMVWGHGPLTGWAEIVDERTARFSAVDIPSHQFLEVRVVWPPGLVEGVPATGMTRESIREEEAGYVRDTIARVRRAQADDAAKRRLVLKGLGLWGIWQIVGPLIWLMFYSRFWSSVGKDYRFDGMPEYTRELPSDLPPAYVQDLMREGRGVTTAAFTATIFDLARRGYAEIDDRTVEKRTLFGSKEKMETRLTLKKDYEQDAGLRPFERDLLDLLFGKLGDPGSRKGSSFTLDDLKDYLKKEPQEFQKWYRLWEKEIKAGTKPLGFLEPESVRTRNIFLVITLPIAILTFSPVLLIVSSVLTPTLKRRTEPWARENEQWKGLKHFLDDFSEFRELPPEALKLWEQYLVFGILFGNAKKILKALPVILQNERAAVPTWYVGAGYANLAATSGHLTSMISSIEHMASTISQASTAAAHYSSGGGGGFSGGGGGGAGGGGGGAG